MAQSLTEGRLPHLTMWLASALGSEAQPCCKYLEKAKLLPHSLLKGSSPRGAISKVSYEGRISDYSQEICLEVKEQGDHQ